MPTNTQMPAGFQRALNIDEAADFLGCSKRHVHSMTKPRGRLKCFKIGRLIRYRLTDLEDFMERNLVR